MADNDTLVGILERQKKDLVSRFLQQHEDARNSRSFIDKILSNISDLLIILSVDLELIQASKEIYNVLGYEPDDPELFLGDIVEEDTCRQLIDLLEEGEFSDREMNLLHRDGQKIPVVMRGALFTTPSGRVLYMLNASDRRDIYSVLEQVREVQNQLIHSGRLASLGEMAAGVGHELTQPLNTVLLLARNSLKAMDSASPDTDMIRENLQTIIDRVNHASTIIRSLKGFASKVQEEAVPTRVNVIILDILNFLEAQLELSGIRVDLDLDEKVIYVLGQEVKLEQVLLNVIQNAIQALAQTSEPVLRIRTFRHSGVDPQTLLQKNYVGIAVSDNGPGIPQDLQAKIFDPFFTTKPVGAGMGLGLSIVERIVRGYGGHLKVQSEPGRATIFSIYLPELEIS